MPSRCRHPISLISFTSSTSFEGDAVDPARHHGARALAREFVDRLSPLVQPGEPDLARGLELFEHHDALGAFDSVLVAIVLERDHLTGLMSADRAFSGITGLTHHDPTESAPA